MLSIILFCSPPLSLSVSQVHTQTYRGALGKGVHKLTNTTGHHIFMAVLSGVTTVHIHLFGISVIDVFFMLPLGLKQYAVQGLCMLMCPLTPAVSNYPWGMEPRLGLQPPAIIWVMAKLHKSFCRKLKKKKKKKKKSFKRGLERAWNKRQEKEREVKAGRKRGSVRKWAMQGFHCFALTVSSPPFYVLISPLWATFTAEAINFGVWCFPQNRIQHSVR